MHLLAREMARGGEASYRKALWFHTCMDQHILASNEVEIQVVLGCIHL